MAGIFSGVFLGVRIFIWLYLMISIFMFGGVTAYYFRERIKKKYYKFRFPEKVVRVIIHHPTNIYRVYWRLIPDNRIFNINGNSYSFDDKKVIKHNDIVGKKISTRNQEDKYEVIVEGKKYYVENELGLNFRKEKVMEAHFFYNNPNQIEFKFQNKKLDFTSKELNDFQENNLFSTLLQLDVGKPLLMFVLFLCIAILVGVGYLVMVQLGVV